MGYEILICLAGLVSGILIACQIPESGVLNYFIPLLLAGLASRLWRPKLPGMSRYGVLAWSLGFCCFFMVGWVSVLTNNYHPDKNRSPKTEILAKVVSYREVTENLGQLVVRITAVRNDSTWKKQIGKIVLLVKPDHSIAYHSGDVWKFGPLSIAPVSSKPSKNGFIPSRYWLSRGVRYEARLASGHARLISKNRYPSLVNFFGQWQNTLTQRIDHIQLSEASRALIKAMIFGDRSDISNETMNDFSKAGIIHVISVSGLHVGIIYFLISWLLKLMTLPGAKARSFISLSVVWLYAGITGLSPSALRSAGMITLFECARIGRRGTSSLEVLASTAIIHCLIDPYTVFSVGAQLSYLAVAGIFIWNPVVNPLLFKCNRISRYFMSTIAISLTAQSLIIPLLFFWFGWFPLYFLIGNIILLPLMVAAFYLGLVITLLDVAGMAIPLLYKFMDFLIELTMNGAAWLGNLPGNLVKPDGLIWADLVLYYMILLFIRSYWDKPDPQKVKRILAGAGLILFARFAGMQFS